MKLNELADLKFGTYRHSSAHSTFSPGKESVNAQIRGHKKDVDVTHHMHHISTITAFEFVNETITKKILFFALTPSANPS